MTPSRLLAGVAVLLLGVACGRLGAPVRTSQARGAGGTSPAVSGGEVPQTQEEEEKEKEEKR